MKNNVPAIAISLIALVVVVLIVVFMVNQTKDFNWNSEFKETGNEPYHLGVLSDLLVDNYDVTKFEKRVEDHLPTDASAAGTSYIFIGEKAYYTEAEAEHILEYVRNGGHAFISSRQLPDSLYQYLIYGDDCDPYDFWRGRLESSSHKTINARFTHPSLSKKRYPYEYITDENQGGFLPFFRSGWGYIPRKYIDCDETTYPISILGELQTETGNKPNFIRIKYQNTVGAVYFHTNPLFFTNYNVGQEAGAEYIANVLAHLDTDKIYWDRKSATRARNDRRILQQPDDNFQNVPSPMQYIYSQRSLRWAWYILLATSILYVLFRAKRRQRIVPVLAPNRNTSLEFVETISRLYYKQQDHRSILIKQMQLFRGHLRDRYQVIIRKG